MNSLILVSQSHKVLLILLSFPFFQFPIIMDQKEPVELHFVDSDVDSDDDDERVENKEGIPGTEKLMNVVDFVKRIQPKYIHDGNRPLFKDNKSKEKKQFDVGAALLTLVAKSTITV
jgi:hypothetical protein